MADPVVPAVELTREQYKEAVGLAAEIHESWRRANDPDWQFDSEFLAVALLAAESRIRELTETALTAEEAEAVVADFLRSSQVSPGSFYGRLRTKFNRMAARARPSDVGTQANG